MRSHLGMRKMSRPYGIVFRPGCTLTLIPFSGATLMVRVSLQRSARHQPEDTLHLAKGITSTTTCPIDCLNRRGSVFIIGTLDIDVERKEISQGIWRENGASSPNKKQLITSGTISLPRDTLWRMRRLISEDTFHSDSEVSSICLHDTRVCEQDKL